MNKVNCGGPNCPICAKMLKGYDKLIEKVTVKNFSTGLDIEIDKSTYDIINCVANGIIDISEKKGIFAKNNGFSWVTIPLANSDKTAILSIRKIEGVVPQYQWMLKKD